MKTIVVSRTLRHADHSEITIISELNRDRIEALRARRGKDIWLFGGGELFRSLLGMGEVAHDQQTPCDISLPVLRLTSATPSQGVSLS